MGNLAGALTIHLVLLPWAALVVLFSWASSVTANGDASVAGFLVAGGVVAGLWLGLAGLVVYWWIRGREELWNVTLAGLTILTCTIYLLPFLFWPRFRHWLGGSLRPWRPPGEISQQASG